MNLKNIGMHVEEMSFKLNLIKAEPNSKFEIKPQFSRNVKKMKELPKRRIVELIMKIENTKDMPKPFDVNVKLVGVFELEDEIWLTEEEKEVAIFATRAMYPYMRSAVASITSSAMMPALHLPLFDGGSLFPEDIASK